MTYEKHPEMHGYWLITAENEDEAEILNRYFVSGGKHFGDSVVIREPLPKYERREL